MKGLRSRILQPVYGEGYEPVSLVDRANAETLEGGSGGWASGLASRSSTPTGVPPFNAQPSGQRSIRTHRSPLPYKTNRRQPLASIADGRRLGVARWPPGRVFTPRLESTLTISLATESKHPHQRIATDSRLCPRSMSGKYLEK